LESLTEDQLEDFLDQEEKSADPDVSPDDAKIRS
jgi:hypothetical protein